jgi:hypothetical protein
MKTNLQITVIMLSTLLLNPKISRASDRLKDEGLSFGIPPLDDAFSGRLSFGALYELGVPLGKGGLEIILSVIGKASKKHFSDGMVLWITPESSPLRVFPPGWLSYGIALEHIYFTATDTPMQSLKPVFLESGFKVVVFDNPLKLKDDDFAFLAIEARKSKQLIFVLRDYFLTSDKGNVWAKARVNIYKDSTGVFILDSLRGLRVQRLEFRGTTP